MPCLRKLCLDGTAITELPSSIGYATEVVRLDLKNCGKLRSLPSSICELTLLQTLSLSGCSDLGKCEVNSGNLDALPRTLDRLCSLQELELQNCRSLRALPALPSSLRIINASNCESLEDITPQSVFSQFRSCMFGNCLKLTKFQSRMERDLQSMAARVDEEVRRPTFEEQNPEIPVLFSTVFPGSGIPDWFEHRSEGHEINIQVSQNWYARNFLGFALSAVVAPEKESLTSGWITYCDLGCGALDSKLKSNGIFSFSFFDVFTKHLEHITIGSDHMWLAYEPSFLGFAEKWSCIKFSFRTDRESCIVKCCGVCPVYAKSNSDDESNSDGDYSYSDNESNSDGDYSYSDDEYKSDTCYSYSDDGDYSYSDNESNSDGDYSYSDDEYKSDTYYSYGDEGNPSGRDLDDLHEWRLEDNTIERSPKEAQSRGSVQENVNDSMLQDTIIRSLDDAEPRGIGYSCTNAHACAMIRRSLHKVLDDIQQSESQEIGCFHTDSRRWDQERFERQPNPSISNIEIRFWVFIIIFSFLLLVRIFYWAPVQIPTLLDAPFWISPLVAAPFGTSTLVAAPFGISSLLPVPFEISTLLGGPLGISILLGGVELLLFILSRQ
ncbi:hypothetical protein PVL29_002333 [Vitis rotundifolia]|nr:hypothetical protein PVL29_002333 [Vitis rotundifolia]